MCSYQTSIWPGGEKGTDEKNSIIWENCWTAYGIVYTVNTYFHCCVTLLSFTHRSFFYVLLVPYSRHCCVFVWARLTELSVRYFIIFIVNLQLYVIVSMDLSYFPSHLAEIYLFSHRTFHPLVLHTRTPTFFVIRLILLDGFSANYLEPLYCYPVVSQPHSKSICDKMKRITITGSCSRKHPHRMNGKYETE